MLHWFLRELCRPFTKHCKVAKQRLSLDLRCPTFLVRSSVEFADHHVDERRLGCQLNNPSTKQRRDLLTSEPHVRKRRSASQLQTTPRATEDGLQGVR
jgi:hypothetical protein